MCILSMDSPYLGLYPVYKSTNIKWDKLERAPLSFRVFGVGLEFGGFRVSGSEKCQECKIMR